MKFKILLKPNKTRYITLPCHKVKNFLIKELIFQK